MRRAGIGVIGVTALSRLLISLFVTTAVSSLAWAEPLASVDEDEVLIGTLDLKGPSSTLDETDARAANANTKVAVNSKPGDSYTQALQALEAGDFVAAQRLFEMTVAADPQGARAAEARRHLGQLYTSARMPDSALSTTDTAMSEKGQPATTDQGPNESNLGSQRLDAAGDEERFVTQAGDRVFFSANSVELGARARSVLAAQAKWLVKRPEWNVIIEGHADDATLSAIELRQLSQHRAQVVHDRLIAEGVAANRISVVSWGRSAPIADCPDTACQAQNRRAVSVLTPQRATGQLQIGQNSGAGAEGAGRPLSAGSQTTDR